MKNGLISFIVLFFVIFASSCKAYAFKVDDKRIEAAISSCFVSRYVWRGQDLYKENDGAHQHDISVVFPESVFGYDLSFDLWASLPVKSSHEDAEELDYSLFLSRGLSEYFDASAGFTYFDFPNANKLYDVMEPWFSLTLKKIPVIPLDISMEIFGGYDFKVASGGPEEGWYYSWGLGTEVPLIKSAFFQNGQALEISITNWGNDGVAGLKPSVLYATEFSFSTTYKFRDFDVTPSLNYSLCYEDEINSGDDELWAAIDISYSF